MAHAGTTGWTRTGALFGRAHRQKAPVQPQNRKLDGDQADRTEAKQPDPAELRRLRTTYYDNSSTARERVPSIARSSTITPVQDRTSSRPPTEENIRRRRKHRSSGTKVDGSGEVKRKSYRHRRLEEYVYGSSHAQSSSNENSTGDPVSTARRWSNGSAESSIRSGLSTVAEDDIVPDDSVSQIGRRKVSKQKRQSSASRPPLARHSTTPTRVTSNAEPDPKPRSSAATTSHKSGRPSSIFGSLLRSKTTSSIPARPQTVECLTCGSDDLPITKSALLECGHRMCNDCLKRVFEMSVKDPAHMPPKCCTKRHIPLKHVERLFDQKFKVLWNRKYQEFHTKDRIYCPTRRCGEWIRPVHIRSVQGRKFAKCPRCKIKVCVLCSAKMHKSEECPKDPEIAKLVQQAKDEGWQTCYQCKAIVEKKDGCNHMTCRCRAQFCIICGLKWKTCDCPWLDHAGVEEGDRLNHMRVPEVNRERVRQLVERLERIPGLPPPPQGVFTHTAELEQRRRQEREDAALAIRLHMATLNDMDNQTPQRDVQGAETWNMVNVTDYLVDNEFVQNAANVVFEAFGNANTGRG